MSIGDVALILAALAAAVAIHIAIVRAVERLQRRRDARHRAAIRLYLAEHPGESWPPVVLSPPPPPGPPVEILGYHGGPVSGPPPRYRSAIKAPLR